MKVRPITLKTSEHGTVVSFVLADPFRRDVALKGLNHKHNELSLQRMDIIYVSL
jgi:hypothetical protein